MNKHAQASIESFFNFTFVIFMVLSFISIYVYYGGFNSTPVSLCIYDNNIFACDYGSYSVNKESINTFKLKSHLNSVSKTYVGDFKIETNYDGLYCHRVIVNNNIYFEDYLELSATDPFELKIDCINGYILPPDYDLDINIKFKYHKGDKTYNKDSKLTIKTTVG